MNRTVACVHDARDDLGQRSRRVDGVLTARLDDRACDSAGMTLFAQDGDDEPEFALTGARDDVGRAWTIAAHAHVERPIEAKRKAARGIVDLHRRDADVEHDAVNRGRAADDRFQVGETVLDQIEPALGLLDQASALGNRALIAIDADDAGARRRQDRLRITAGTKGGIDVKSTVTNAKPFDGAAAEHGNMTSRSASDSVAARHSSRTPSWFSAANWVPGTCLKARTFAVASANSLRKRPGSQIWNLWPRPTNDTVSAIAAWAF